MADKMRVDVFLTEYGYTKSRQNAKLLIESGKVLVDGRVVAKASELVSDGEHNVVIEQDRYVCRGGLKLEGALQTFGIDVKDFVALDVGASTGGFTDCLLQHGAKRVYAVDSGHGQLASTLVNKKEVINREGVNARSLLPSDFCEKFDIVVMDVSFISQTLIIPALVPLILDTGVIVSLIKPQFEAGRAAVGKNGIVKRKEDREAAIMRVLACAELNGLVCTALMRSPIDGGDGNMEFLALFQRKIKNQTSVGREIIKEMI